MTVVDLFSLLCSENNKYNYFSSTVLCNQVPLTGRPKQINKFFRPVYFTLCSMEQSFKIFTLGIQIVPYNRRNHPKPHLLKNVNFVFSEVKLMEGTPCLFFCHFLLQSPISLGDNIKTGIKAIFLSFFVCHRSVKICHVSEVQAKCC